MTKPFPGAGIPGLPAVFRSAAVALLAAPLVALAQASTASSDSAKFAKPEPRFTFEVQKNVMVPMRDGVRLATDVYMPQGAGARVPVIVMRTPYSKDTPNARQAARGTAEAFFAGQGYAVLFQNVRGKGTSEGEFAVEMADAQDGYDTIDWAAKQPWSTGKIGTFGCSYQGEIQYLSLKMRHPNHLAAIPAGASGAVGPTGALYKNFGSYEGGAFLLSTTLGWFSGSGSKVKGGFKRTNDIPVGTLVTSLPTNKIWEKGGYGPSDFQDFITHPPADPYWDQMHYLRDDDRFTTPALHVNSWFDVTPDGTLQAFNLMRRNADNAAAREQQVIMSPTNHCGSENATEHTKVGAADVGDARYPYWRLYLDWFDHWLKGVDNGVTKRPAVQFYVTGKNEWRTASAWPVPGTKFTSYYLSSTSGAASGSGDGRLTSAAPARAGRDIYVYDPADPVPSKGGTICCTGDPKQKPGIFDQGEMEARRDVLVYSTAPLATPVAVAGPVKLVLYASSDAKDTDFAAKLIDVDAEGHPWNVTNGILRARYREGMTKSVLMQKDSVYRIEVSLKVTAHQFAAGHRIRLYVTSSDFPMYDRNLNTGGDNISEATFVKATNSIHFGGVRGSALVLPVVP